MTCLKLTLEYDGSAFHGWQAQPGDVRTVGGEFARAVSTIAGESPALVAAGRTDAGAHSLGQVVSFELAGEVDPARVREALNAVLPPDVVVVDAEAVEPGFHARFSARRRHYRYLVQNRGARSAVLRGRAWQVGRELDLAAMRSAARSLVGRNDLAGFGTDPGGRNTVRNLQRLSIRRLREASGALLAFELTADAFLYGMVRRIVGFLVEVGLSRRDPSEATAFLNSSGLVPVRVAPAHGLYQLGVEY